MLTIIFSIIYLIVVVGLHFSEYKVKPLVAIAWLPLLIYLIVTAIINKFKNHENR